MKILFLDFDISKQDFYRNLLNDISSKNELIFFTHPNSLLDYFKDIVIPQQEHIDLIISDIAFINYTFKDFLEFFRTSNVNYSYSNFKLSSIPIVLHTQFGFEADYHKLGIDLIIPKPINENHNDFCQQIKTIITSWRKKIFDDLEVLGIGLDFDFTKVSVGYSIKVRSERTSILSSAFVLKQNRLPYLWIDKHFFQQEATIEELESLVNQYMTSPKNELERRKWESQLQVFFMRNPQFILNDSYSKFWSEPRLYYPKSTKFIKPDFVTKPIISPELGKNWHVFDLKLPIQEFLQQTEFHKSFTSKFQKCLTQITDYKEYFKSDKNKENIERKFNFHPKHPKMTLIVGRRSYLLEQQDKIFERLSQMNYADINLLTYDEIVDYQKKELERLLENRIL